MIILVLDTYFVIHLKKIVTVYWNDLQTVWTRPKNGLRAQMDGASPQGVTDSPRGSFPHSVWRHHSSQRHAMRKALRQMFTVARGDGTSTGTGTAGSVNSPAEP